MQRRFVIQLEASSPPSSPWSHWSCSPRARAPLSADQSPAKAVLRINRAVMHGSRCVENDTQWYSDTTCRPWKLPQAKNHSGRDSCCLSNPHEWPGLTAWRAKGRDLRLRWGPPPGAAEPLELPTEEAPSLESAMALAATSAAVASTAPGDQQALGPLLSTSAPAWPVLDLRRLPGSLVEAGVVVLRTADPAAKAALTHAAWGAYLDGRLPLHPPEVAAAAAAMAAAAAAIPLSWEGSPQHHLALQQQRHHHHHHHQQQHQQQVLREPRQGQGQGQGQQHHQQGGAARSLSVGQGGPDPSGPPLALQMPLLLPDHPARPDRPRLVRPKEIPGHESSPLGLNGYMMHNLAHIELNAINLAWDTLVRFSHLGLPDQFYEDFARVADDESRHLGWCLQRLGELGHRYGDMDAHDLLWQGCRASALDVGARLAVVPMSQEARGLDAGSRLVSRLVGFGDPRSAAVVALIAEEERAHVAVGVTWFTRLCDALGIEPGSLYRQWLLHLNPDLLKGPFNHTERSRVGLLREWYDPTSWTEHGEEQLQQQQHYYHHHQQQQQQQQEGSIARSAGNASSLANTNVSSSPPVGAPLPWPDQVPQPPPSVEDEGCLPGGRRPQPLRLPTRGSPHPRLTGPQPCLTHAQLALLAERLAVFGNMEATAAATATATCTATDSCDSEAPFSFKHRTSTALAPKPAPGPAPPEATCNQTHVHSYTAAC